MYKLFSATLLSFCLLPLCNAADNHWKVQIGSYEKHENAKNVKKT
jgi:hypothetical protein